MKDMLSIAAMDDALSEAKAIAGGPSKLAAAIGGLRPQAVSQWKRCPPNRVLDVERITGVPRYRLRPDLYPHERASASERTA